MCFCRVVPKLLCTPWSCILSVVLAWGFRCWREKKKPNLYQKVAVVIFACSITWLTSAGFVLVLLRLLTAFQSNFAWKRTCAKYSWSLCHCVMLSVKRQNCETLNLSQFGIGINNLLFLSCLRKMFFSLSTADVKYLKLQQENNFEVGVRQIFQ